jgi:broad specificity phosphatase PhoE
MRTLIFVRHSLPEIVPTIPASRWHLTEEGKRRCRPLAEMLTPYQPKLILTSREPKAVETGQLLARFWHLSAQSFPDLHEHCRENVGIINSKQEFEQRVATFFQHPDTLVFGSETAEQATRRFCSAVEQIASTYTQKTIVIVAHGTVLSLYAGACSDIDPHALWQRLQMPAFMVVSLPGFKIEKIVEGVPDNLR